MRHSNKLAVGMLQGPTSREALAEAFADFTRAAGLLEHSYRELQQEVAGLRLQLEEKNRHLASSLSENERIRQGLQRLIETLPCGVVLLAKGNLRRCNPEAERLLAGVDDRSVISAITDDSTAEQEHEVVLDALGGPRPIALRQAALIGAEGDAQILLILRDTTAQRRLEEERQNARRLQALAESTALLAHEVRNPLASMELFASLLVDACSVENHDIRNYARHIQAGVRLTAATVNNVLHLRNAGPLQLRTVDLIDLLDSTIKLLDPVASQRGVRINFQPLAGGNASLAIQADRSRLQQVFFNLAVNAFRAMQAGGVLTVSVPRPEGNTALVEFRDQGCGIAPEDVEKVFEPGFSRTPGSSGFGLAVCRKIMDQHGGSICLTSQRGEGTTISLTFVQKGEA